MLGDYIDQKRVSECFRLLRLRLLFVMRVATLVADLTPLLLAPVAQGKLNSVRDIAVMKVVGPVTVARTPIALPASSHLPRFSFLESANYATSRVRRATEGGTKNNVHPVWGVTPMIQQRGFVTPTVPLQKCTSSFHPLLE